MWGGRGRLVPSLFPDDKALTKGTAQETTPEP